MNKIIPSQLVKNRLVSRLYQVAVALWFLRMVLPGVKYVFIPALFLLTLVTLFSLKGDLFKKEYVYEFLKTFNPLIILGLFYGLGIVFTNQLSSKVIVDLFEYGVNFLFLIIFFALTYYSAENEGFFWVFKRMSRVIWVTAVLVAILGLMKFVMQQIGIDIPYQTPWGTSLNADKNFYALYSFLGLIGLYPRFFKASSFKEAFVSNSLVVLLLLNIIFSYSPRSILILSILAITLIVTQITSLFLNKSTGFSQNIKKLRFLSLLFLVSIILTVLLYRSNHITIQNVSLKYFGVETVQSEFDSSVFHENSCQFEKWDYAIEYFKAYKPHEKIFGGGFDYLSDFGNKFNGNASYIDYPHNPLLSGLLYSGIVGAVFIFIFLAVSFYYALIYFKEHPLFTLMLLVCTMFVFFSGNSIFSVPIFLFLFSLSFMIRHQEITDLSIDANLAKPGSKYLKESFDYIAAVIGIIVLFPLLLVIGVFVLFASGWPVVFTQTRVGQNGKLFRLHKFRSMKNVKSDTTVAAAETMRITKIGAFIRKTKIDELPELWNIIRGDMSFVGTRPDVPGYADKLEGNDRIILKLKPGITGPASLKYINEEDILSEQSDPQEYNDTVIWPDKVRINKEYYENWSFFTDIKIILFTILKKQI